MCISLFYRESWLNPYFALFVWKLQFAGTWHYLELYTEDSAFPADQLFCLKLDVTLKGMDIHMNITIPKPVGPNPGIPEPALEILLVANMFGWVDETTKRPGPGEESADERRIEVGTPSIRRISVGRFQLHSLTLGKSLDTNSLVSLLLLC